MYTKPEVITVEFEAVEDSPKATGCGSSGC